MSEWTWVAVGFLVAYGSLAGYVAILARRVVRVRRQEEKLR